MISSSPSPIVSPSYKTDEDEDDMTTTKRTDKSADEELLNRILTRTYPDSSVYNQEEDLYTFFRRFPEKDWTGISIEAMRLLSLMFPELDKDGDLFFSVECIVSAVANQSAESVWNVVSSVLSRDKEELYELCAKDYENHDDGHDYWKQRKGQ